MTKKSRSNSSAASGTAVQSRATRSAGRSRKSSARAQAGSSVSIPRATSGYNEDDVLLSGGGSARSGGFGRCGGRVLSSQIEQTLCDKLSRAGITHSHSPRHFEVRFEDDAVAAYAPMVVLRGRGREGKTVVIEAATTPDSTTLGKIAAFRSRLGVEFYVIFIAPEEVIDDVPLAVYDESCTTNDLDTLIGRLSE